MDILGLKLCPELLQLLFLFLQLRSQVIDGFLEFLPLEGAGSELAFEFLDEFPVLLHGSLDKLHVLAQPLAITGTLAVFGDIDPSLSLVDFPEALFNLIHGSHHVVDFILSLGDNLVERIPGLHQCGIGLLGLILLASSAYCHQDTSHP